MDQDPKTRQEIKGGKKKNDKNVYSSKHVRQMEALIEKKANTSSTLKTPVNPDPPSSSKK